MQDNPVGDHVLAWVGNGASIGAVVSTMLGWLPPIAAVIAFIWYLIQIYESDTIQKWVRRRRVRKIAKLRAAIVILETKGKLEDSGG